jgi:hypothetical protein
LSLRTLDQLLFGTPSGATRFAVSFTRRAPQPQHSVLMENGY